MDIKPLFQVMVPFTYCLEHIKILKNCGVDLDGFGVGRVNATIAQTFKTNSDLVATLTKDAPSTCSINGLIYFPSQYWYGILHKHRVLISVFEVFFS